MIKLLLPLLILLAATVSAQERPTASAQEYERYYFTLSGPLVALGVTHESALIAWESQDFSRLEKGTEIRLILSADTVRRLREHQPLDFNDRIEIANSLVIALGIVLPPPVCETEEPDRDDLRRFIRVPSEQMCRKRWKR